MSKSDFREPNATVSIVTALPFTRKIKATDLRVGDFVHDAYGNEYRLTKVNVRKASVVIRREDGRTETWALDLEVTVRRPLTAEEVVARVIDLWDGCNGWIPGAARRDLAEALNVPIEALALPSVTRLARR